jgi:hypothetical protein
MTALIFRLSLVKLPGFAARQTPARSEKVGRRAASPCVRQGWQRLDRPRLRPGATRDVQHATWRRYLGSMPDPAWHDHGATV